VRAPLERRPLADGEEGIEQTRREMMRLINEGSADLEIIQEARRATLLVRPHDTTGEIAAVFDYVTGLGTPYRFDPVGKEMLQAATHTSHGRDCDCFVIWAGSLLQALGHPVRVVIGAKRRLRAGAPAWSHTWLEVYDLRQKAWVSFDPVLHLRAPGLLAAVGDVAPMAVLWRSAAVSGYEGAEALAGLNGFSLKKLAKGVAKVGKKLSTGVVGGVLKRVVSVVPGGQAALTAIDVTRKAVGVIKAVKKGGIGQGLATVAKVAAPALIGGGKVGSGLKASLDTLSAGSNAVKKVRAAVRPATTRAPAPARALSALKLAPRPAAAPPQRGLPSAVAKVARPLIQRTLPVAATASGPTSATASKARTGGALNMDALPPKLRRLTAQVPAPADYEEPQAAHEEPQLEEEAPEAEEGSEETASADEAESSGEADFSEPTDDEEGPMEGEE
jgi:hypothetical protein